ncbi:MAG: M20/M25/M40 family metallo-hydrolase [Pseudomonadota bacterium]
MRPVRALLTALFTALPTLAIAAESPISGARQLTFEGKRAGEGYFAADGSAMIFQSERDEKNPFYQMYLMDLESGDVDLMSPGIGKTTCGWIAPDGSKVMFSSTHHEPEAEAKMQAELDFRASGQTRRYSWDYDPEYEIFARDLATGEFTRLTDAPGYDAEGSYSPDGSKILFASNRHAYSEELTEAEAKRLEIDPSYFMDLYVMDGDGSNVRRLTDVPGYDGGPFWSADGSQFTWRRFSESGKTAEVFVANADGSNQRPVTDMGVMSWAPFFHPSGAYLIFNTNLLGFANFELYIVDVAGTREPVRVSDRDGFDGLATFTPDGKKISWTSNATSTGTSHIFLADWDHEAALALLDAAPVRAAAATSTVPATQPGIEVADIKAHVDALTSEEMAGRLTGTEGERLATAYVADVFAALGLVPAGDDGTYFQPFDFTAGVDLGPANALSVSIDGEATDKAVGEAWTPLAFSATGAVEQAPVAFAGYGLFAAREGDQLGINSYGDLDVTDKWVLIWRGMPGDADAARRTWLSRFADMRYKAAVAKSRGAKGVIFMPPLRNGFDDGLPRLSYEAISGAASLPSIGITRAEGAAMLSILGDDLETMKADAEAGKPASRDLIGVSITTEIDLTFETRTGRNVLGRLALGDSDAPPLMIGAHVDHLGRGETSGSLATSEEAGQLHLGADDNASGVAAVIEVAERLADLHASGKLKANRDVVFAAWSGEELGLLGATHFTEAAAETAGTEDLADQVSAYINLDMVGRLDDKVVVGGIGSSPIWEREIERRNAIIGLPIVTNADPYLPTDATAFYLAKVPVMSLFTGAHTDYHTPRDTADKLNYDGIRDIARFVALVARSRVKEAEEPPYVERERPRSEGGGRMSGVFLGTIPDYAQEGVTGVALSGVVKGGPAEEAGLTGGDVMVGLAGQELENIYDFVRTLNGLKPGETVPVAVMRDGARVEMEVTPRTRDK